VHNYTDKIELKNLKVAYAKNYIDSLPITVQAVELQDAGVQVVAIDFPSTCE
jgi:hypothetical protein